VNDGFAAFEHKVGRIPQRPIEPYIIRDPVTVDPNEHVAAAAAALVDRRIRRLPVIQDGRLVGTVSRADICRTMLGTPV
jgi:CBS domain-containing protein